jgi:phosphohistidine phosphatase
VTAHILILLRHAKADWPVGVPDHERPLAPRGMRDAPHTGTWLADAGRMPDLVLCSDALRTRQTYELAAADWDPAPEVRYTDDIYGVSAGDMLEVIRSVPDEVGTLMLVSHNPGTQRLALALADESHPELVARIHIKYPTNTVAVLATDASWSQLDPGGAAVVDLATPRG